MSLSAFATTSELHLALQRTCKKHDLRLYREAESETKTRSTGTTKNYSTHIPGNTRKTCVDPLPQENMNLTQHTGKHVHQTINPAETTESIVQDIYKLQTTTENWPINALIHGYRNFHFATMTRETHTPTTPAPRLPRLLPDAGHLGDHHLLLPPPPPPSRSSRLCRNPPRRTFLWRRRTRRRRWTPRRGWQR